MMTTKAVASERATLVLETVRELFDERVLHNPRLQAVGINFDHGGSLTLGDVRLNGIILEAGRASGFGQRTIDAEIRRYLDNHHGYGRWRHDRAPHPWERAGGDPTLEQLLDEEDAALAERERLEAEMWAKWDAKQALEQRAQRGSQVSVAEMNDALKALGQATDVWEIARQRETKARGQVCNRQCFLQEKWLREQSAQRER